MNSYWVFPVIVPWKILTVYTLFGVERIGIWCYTVLLTEIYSCCYELGERNVVFSFFVITPDIQGCVGPHWSEFKPALRPFLWTLLHTGEGGVWGWIR